MTAVDVTGIAIPRLSRREVAELTRRALLAIGHVTTLPFEISEVTVAFVDDGEMRRLNRTFRRKDRTTDVLTFPADDSYGDPDSGGRPLGDIVISVEQARRQAVTEHHSLSTEIRYLVLHGLLHALGYDHETDSGEMNELELEVRSRTGL